jgi:carboxypeptidase C (cathepsin A)
MYLNGLMLVSSILNFQADYFDLGNDLPFALFLPTYAATAWYHKQLPEELQALDLKDLVAEVESFSRAEYTLALMQGASLSEERRKEITDKLANYTGLSSDYIERADLRVAIMRFTKELLRTERRTVGRLDSRFTGIDRDSVGEEFEHDPSLSIIMGPYTACFNQYVRSDLNFESDLPYEIISLRVRPWSYAEHENRYVNVSETLRKSMSTNPFMKVFVANGYYDLATPYFATEYTFNHLGLDPSLQDNISMGYYEAGHMMYIHLPSLQKMKADLSEFIRSALPERK